MLNPPRECWSGRSMQIACMDALEQRRMLSNAPPYLDDIPDATVPAGKTVVVPITASDADGDALTYTYTSSNKAFKIITHPNNPFIRLTVQGYNGTTTGTLTFELLHDVAPATVDHIMGLVQGEYYDGLTFHRITDLSGGQGTVRQFIVQGGDAAGTGSGTPPFTFNDEFNIDTIFSGYGQLAMANSGPDTNGTQFFITTNPTRFLDYKHTIFGQLVRGSDVLNQLAAVPTDVNGKPNTTVTIVKAEVIQDTADSVITIQGPKTGSTLITVKVGDGHGGLATKLFKATAAADSTNERPFFHPQPKDMITKEATPLSINLKAYDAESDSIQWGGGFLNGTNAYAVLELNMLTIVPYPGFTGPIQLKLYGGRCHRDRQRRYAGCADVHDRRRGQRHHRKGPGIQAGGRRGRDRLRRGDVYQRQLQGQGQRLQRQHQLGRQPGGHRVGHEEQGWQFHDPRREPVPA